MLFWLLKDNIKIKNTGSYISVDAQVMLFWLLKDNIRIKNTGSYISVDAQVMLFWLLKDNIKIKNIFTGNRVKNINDIKNQIEKTLILELNINMYTQLITQKI